MRRLISFNKIRYLSCLSIFLVLLVPVLGAATTESSDLTDVGALTLSLVNQDPDPAVSGDTVEIRVGVQNIGGEAVDDVMLEFTPEYPFSLAAGEEAVNKIGSVSGYQSDDNIRIVKFKVVVDKDTIAGTYEAKVKYFQEGSSVKTQTTLSVDVQSRENAEVIHIDKTTLVPGREDELKFTINNVGNAPLRDMSFYWENEDDVVLPVGSDNTKYIKYIDVGESAQLEYKVIADTDSEPGLYKLDLYLTYDDPLTDEEKQISTIAGVYVGGETDFEVAYSDSSGTETSFTVANIGSNPAYSVSVSVPEQQGWSVSGAGSSIIGNLNAGDYTVASFTISQAEGGPGMASTDMTPEDFRSLSEEERAELRETMSDDSGDTVKIQITYTDTKGERRTVEKEVEVGLSSSSAVTASNTDFGANKMRIQQESSFSKYRWYITGLAALVVFIVFYSRYKKRKQMDPSYKMADIFSRKKRQK